GIDAPREIRVYRKELLDETASINKSATRVPPVSFQNAQPAADAKTAPSVEKGSAENTAPDAAENTAPHAGENTAPEAAPKLTT
ncbi:MAG: carbon storage regulator, partial [Clostridiales bacterium]|nr:carbon storage regulator [Clostridiales bacterium]